MVHFGLVLLAILPVLNVFGATKVVSNRSKVCAQSLSEKNIWSTQAQVVFDVFQGGAAAEEIAERIRSYRIKSEKERFAIAMLVAGSADAGAVAKHIKLFDIRSEDLRYQIALKASENAGIEVSKYIDRFNIHGVEKKTQIAKAAIKSKEHGWKVLKVISNFKIKNQDRLKEIALLAIERSTYLSKFDLGEVGLTRVADRIEVLRAVVEKKETVSFIIDTLNIDDESVRLEFAHADAENDPMLLARNIQHFQITSELNRFELAKKIFKWNAATPAGYMARRPEGYLLLSNFKLSQAHELELLVDSIQRAPLAVISGIMNVNLDAIHEFENTTTSTDLKRVLLAFSKRHPTLLNPEFVDVLGDRVRNRNVVLRLIEEAYKAGTQFTDSIQILSVASGLDLTVLGSENFSEKSVAQVYELLLDIQSELQFPAFRGVKLGAKVFSERRLTALIVCLTRARDLLHISGNSSASWAKIKNEYFSIKQTEPLSVRDLEQISKRIGDAVVDRVIELFSGTDLSFTYEQLGELSQKWNGLEAVYTLLARFRGNPYWKKEIPILGEVFQAALLGQFHEYKFFSEAAVDQTRVLKTFEQRQAWALPRVLVTASKEQNDSALAQVKDVLQTVRAIISRNLLEHTKFSKMHASVVVDVRNIKDPNDTVQRWLAEYDTLSVARSLIEALSLEQDPNQISVLASALKILSFKDSSWLDPGELMQVRDDLDSIVKTIKPARRTNAGGDELIVTVVTSDPNFLLTIGDLVQTSSCQNYRTGSQIQTLLGYVIDANVQALASFAVGQSSFGSFDDYRSVYEVYARGDLLNVEFDGNRRVLKFSFPGNAVVVETRPLGHAYLRQMLKLGENRSHVAALVTESEYVQSHSRLAVMRAQHHTLVRYIAADIGAKIGGNLSIAKTRNPGGVYSDLAGGVKNSNYTIKSSSPIF